MTLTKFYYYFFYKIYNFSIHFSDDALNELKPGIIISVLQIFLMMDIIIWYTIITKKDVGPNWPYILLVVFICVSNYYVFLYKNKWKKYFDEFKHYNKRKNILGGWFVFFTIILITTSLIFSFYEMSLINWEAYR